MLQAEPVELVAKLTPLGWVCAGPINCQRGGDLQKNFAFTYFVKDQRPGLDEISNLVRGFWEIESYVAHVMTLKKLEESIKYVVADIKRTFLGKMLSLNYQTITKWHWVDCQH